MIIHLLLYLYIFCFFFNTGNACVIDKEENESIKPLASKLNNEQKNTLNVIELIEGRPQENEQLRVLCDTHRGYHLQSKKRDFSRLNFDDVNGTILRLRHAKQEYGICKFLGVYGLYLKEAHEGKKLVGIIKMSKMKAAFQGYAECEMTMHPNYRGKGLGSAYRQMFHEQIVLPHIGSRIKTLYDDETKIIKEATFRGTVGYIHIYNLASRRLVTKLKHVPVALSHGSYLGGKEAFQIVYVYPPLPEKEKHLCVLRTEVINIILKNKLEDNFKVILKYRSEKDKVSLFFEDIYEKFKNSPEMRKLFSLEALLQKLMEQQFIPAHLSRLPEDLKLERLVKEVALLEDIQEVTAENKNYFSDQEIWHQWFKEQNLHLKREELIRYFSD